MKFAHEFQDVLRKENFPAAWRELAISYSQLKKCIKKLQGELLDLGLDARTLSELLVSAEPGLGSSGLRPDKRPLFQYAFGENEDYPRPQLFVIIDTQHGQLVDARLSEETKAYLRKMISERASAMMSNDGVVEDHSQREVTAELGEISSQSESGDRVDGGFDAVLRLADNPSTHGAMSSKGKADGPEFNTTRMKVPLTFNSEFFGLLELGLNGVDQLQEKEQMELSTEVVELGRVVARAAAPSGPAADIDSWREIFDIYIQSNTFFSTAEQDHGIRSAAAAARQLRWFSEETTRKGLGKQFKNRESHIALDRFMRLNMRLLRNLTFQEINQTAMVKILKKFDKRTALGVKNRFPKVVAKRPFLARSVAKAVCFKVAQEILSTVPQLNDYLCPICFNVAYKPIRLQCGHIFCIRCMITMQRSRATHCPLCRSDVVLKAGTANLDTALMNFLKQYFPKEVKAKQKENEKAVALEMWGEDFEKCALM